MHFPLQLKCLLTFYMYMQNYGNTLPWFAFSCGKADNISWNEVDKGIYYVSNVNEMIHFRRFLKKFHIHHKMLLFVSYNVTYIHISINACKN